MLIKLIKLVSWFIGIGLIFFGFLGLSDSVIGGLLTIFSGLFITPITYRWLKKYFHIGQMLRVVIAGVFIVIGFPMMVGSDTQSFLPKTSFIPKSEHSEQKTPEQTIEDADIGLLNAIDALTSRSYDEASAKSMNIITELNTAFSNSDVANDEVFTNNLLARHEHALLIYKTAQLLKQKDQVFANLEETKIIDLIPQLEILERGYRENAQDWIDAADLIESMKTDNLTEDTLKNFRLISSVQKAFAKDIDEKVEEFRKLAPDYVPVAKKIIPKNIPANNTMIPPELEKFFSEFDKDGDKKLSMVEAQDFFYWVEDNIIYRYDDENETDPFVGTLVGDGQPGSDWRQKPITTFSVKAGDCEDMSTLEQAFYKYFGIDSYVVGVNSETPTGIDHAATVVKIGEHVQEFKDFLGDIFYYEVGNNAKDVFGKPVPPGAYLVVDNSYSAAFGSISGGVMEGRYKVHCAIPLERGYGDEWETVKDRCAVSMD